MRNASEYTYIESAVPTILAVEDGVAGEVNQEMTDAVFGGDSFGATNRRESVRLNGKPEVFDDLMLPSKRQLTGLLLIPGSLEDALTKRGLDLKAN